MSKNQRAHPTDTLNRLQLGSVEVLGQVRWSDNELLLVAVTWADESVNALYKPLVGEAPLRDFEPGLYKRERAAYILADALDWNFVPETVIRDDAPAGPGSLQLIIDAEAGQNFFTINQDPQYQAQLRRIAAFDVISNNTDRKGGHILVQGPRLWGIDHGLCFHADPKLRTVIWDFEGQTIDDDILLSIEGVSKELPNELNDLLTDEELDAFVSRCVAVLNNPRYPSPTSNWSYPWPLV